MHAALLVLALMHPAGGAPDSGVPVRPSHLGDDERMHLLPSQQGDSDGLACAKKYRGIGSVISYSGHVSEVVAGGPADRAGMRVGDRFLNADSFARNQFEIGHPMTLRIERDGVLLELPVRIDRICYDEERG